MRQKLLEHSGKSPDPNEVAEEMTRDKGYSRLPEKEVEYSRSRSGAYSNIHMEHRSLPPDPTIVVARYRAQKTDSPQRAKRNATMAYK